MEGTEVKVKQPPKVRRKGAAAVKAKRKRSPRKGKLFNQASKAVNRLKRNAKRFAQKLFKGSRKTVKRFAKQGQRAFKQASKGAKRGFKQVAKARRRAARAKLRAMRKAARGGGGGSSGGGRSHWKLMKKSANLLWGIKLLKKLMKKQKVDGRNHGFTGVRKKNLTGLAGR